VRFIKVFGDSHSVWIHRTLLALYQLLALFFIKKIRKFSLILPTHAPYIYKNTLQRHFFFFFSVALVRERTIPTERPPPVGEVSANFCG